MPFDGPPQSSGNAAEGGVPCRAGAVHHRMQEPRFEPQSLAERGALGTEAAGWLLSPAMAAPPAPSGVATTPQPTPQ